MNEKIKQNKRTTGALYEQMAGAFLENQGMIVLQYNYFCRLGEVDIIAKDGEYIVFCEVKYRRDGRRGNPLEAVGPGKQKRIVNCARFYIMEHRLPDVPIRFDVIGIEGEKITHIKDAF